MLRGKKKAEASAGKAVFDAPMAAPGHSQAPGGIDEIIITTSLERTVESQPPWNLSHSDHLKPGKYKVEVTVDGTHHGEAPIEVLSGGRVKPNVVDITVRPKAQASPAGP